LLFHRCDECPSSAVAGVAERVAGDSPHRSEGEVADLMQLARPLLAAVFLDAARRRVPADARDWFETETAALAGIIDSPRLVAAFVAAARHTGRGPLALDVEERASLRSIGVTWPLDAWRSDELIRVAMLLGAAARLTRPPLEDLVERCYWHGDGRERQAVLRALPLLPDPERFLTLALDAARSTTRPVFEAVACDNPYPARHFHEVHFNPLVMKALAADLPLDRIVGLGARVTAELMRLARAHVAERRASGRSIPPDAWRLTAEVWSAA
jgi:hypothetical protein